MKPTSIFVDNSQIYIAEKATVSIYGKKDLTLLKKFGKEGEGPAEFKINRASPIILTPLHDKLAITSKGRLSYFKKDGSYIKEMSYSQSSPVYPMGNSLLFLKNIDAAGYVSIYTIANQNFEKIAELDTYTFPVNFDKKQWDGVFLFSDPVFSDGYVFLTRGPGIEINGYNSVGKRQIAVKYEDEKVKIPDEYKRVRREKFRAYPDLRRFHTWLHFDEHFPGIQALFIFDRHIFVKTYRKKENEAEFLVLNFKGDLKKRVYWPLAYEDYLTTYPYTIHDWKLYQLVEDIDEEEWSLQITDLK
ncbi:MAG: hypothetical protein GY765_00660 [bacterium]|nr:hypothetical protein [bacterium]